MKWNPVGWHTSPKTIPADPEWIFLFISTMLWARRKDLVQSALGFCSVQGVIFFPFFFFFAYSHFLDITERTSHPQPHQWSMKIDCILPGEFFLSLKILKISWEPHEEYLPESFTFSPFVGLCNHAENLIISVLLVFHIPSCRQPCCGG